MFNFPKKDTKHWPATDADFAKGGVYDQNTEEGKRAYEHAFYEFEVPTRSDPATYMPTLLGYTWLTADKFTDAQLEWAYNEYYRQMDVESGLGLPVDRITTAFLPVLNEIQKRGLRFTPPSFPKDSKEVPTPPHDPTRGR